MSFFSALHTFGSWVEKELIKIENAAPKIERTADAVLKYVGPALAIIAGMAGGPAASAVVGNVISEAQKDLLAASGLIHDFGPTPNAASIVASVQANIGALLTDGHITDPAHVANVNKIVNELAGLVTALSAAPAI